MKRLILSIALVAFAANGFAQELPRDGYDQPTGTYERITKRGPYMTNKFWDNWFIGLGGGVNMYFGSDDQKANFGDRIAPAVDVNFGKWFTPTLGLRIGYSGFQAKGVSLVDDAPYIDGPINGNLYPEKFYNFNIHGDLLWNISNAISGYRENRFWDFVPFIGFGWARNYTGGIAKFENQSNQFAVTYGLLNKLRLGGVIDLTIEARFMTVKSEFDGVKGNSKTGLEGMASLTAGLTFNLGPKEGFKRPIIVAPADYTPYEQRIAGLEEELAAATALAAQKAKELEDCLNRPMPKAETKFVPVTLNTFFKMGKAELNDAGKRNLDNIATSMIEGGGNYLVTGTADAGTGSLKRNEELGKMRAEAVKAYLVEKGVSADAIETANKVIDPGTELDRAVIIEIK
jgi:outer membrane protein OmpA-like peptidoglycan-associated protein